MDSIAPQVPLSVEFSRQEYWRRLPFPPPLRSRQSANVFMLLIHTNFFSRLNVSSAFFQFFRSQLWILCSAVLLCSPKFGFGVFLWASGHFVFPVTWHPAYRLQGDAYLSIIHWTVNSMKTGNLLLVKSLEPRKMLGAWYSLSKYLLNKGNSILGRCYKVRLNMSFSTIYNWFIELYLLDSLMWREGIMALT